MGNRIWLLILEMMAAAVTIVAVGVLVVVVYTLLGYDKKCYWELQTETWSEYVCKRVTW